MKAVFLSDVHLTGATDPRLGRLVAFLQGLRSGPGPLTHLFLVGDIFDLWIADHAFFQRQFTSLIDEIRAMVRAGVEVHVFEGNHDLHLESFWQREVGARVHGQAECFQLGRNKVRVEHGDQMNPDDRGYLFLRWFLRTPPLKALAFHLPAKLVTAIGERASRASRDYTSTAKELPVAAIRAMIRSHAERSHRESAFDVIISGHVHVRDDQELADGEAKFRSINLGSWLDPEPFALQLTDNQIGWVKVP